MLLALPPYPNSTPHIGGRARLGYLEEKLHKNKGNTEKF